MRDKIVVMRGAMALVALAVGGCTFLISPRTSTPSIKPGAPDEVTCTAAGPIADMAVGVGLVTLGALAYVNGQHVSHGDNPDGPYYDGIEAIPEVALGAIFLGVGLYGLAKAKTCIRDAHASSPRLRLANATVAVGGTAASDAPASGTTYSFGATSRFASLGASVGLHRIPIWLHGSAAVGSATKSSAEGSMLRARSIRSIRSTRVSSGRGRTGRRASRDWSA